MSSTKTITAKEVSENLPMRVKSLATSGLFAGDIIRFDKINEDVPRFQLEGKTVGKNRFIAVMNPNMLFELL